MLPRSLSKPTWYPKSIIATACCMTSQMIYWIIFSEFRTMLLGWSSGCIYSAISHQHWPHHIGSLSIAGSMSRLQWWFTSPKWLSHSLHVYRRSPAALRYTTEAALGWQATPFTAALLVEIIWWLCVLLCSPSCIEQYPTQTVAKTVDDFKVKLKTHFYSVSFA